MTPINALLYKAFCQGFCGDCEVAAFRLVFVSVCWTDFGRWWW